MTPSKSMNIAGKAKITSSMLITAPLAISMHIELIISMSEYKATPNVAAKSHIPDTMIEGIDV
jgi:hypothetical protein